MDGVHNILGIKTHNRRFSSHNSTGHGNEFEFHAREQRRAAPLTKGGWTCTNESYRFPINDSPKDPWEQCFEVVDKADDELYKELKEEISGLLVVASLFMGIVTAFASMSLGWIRVDDAKLSTALLGDIMIAKLLNGTDTRGTVPSHDASLNSPPRDSEIVVNQMWFLSMILSLSAVVIGTLCLQWLSAFRRRELKQRPYEDALALRQLRFEGFVGWGIPHAPWFLLLTVQSAIVLFTIGLMYLLWSVNKRVAIPVVAVSGLTALVLIVTTVMPLLQSVVGWMCPRTLVVSQCPYKSPISWVFHRGCVLLSIIVTLPFGFRPDSEVSKWRKNQFRILTDCTWQAFDDLWRRQREHRGPQQSKNRSKYSYYLVHGLASAMEKLVFKPNAVHIIHTCLQDFHGTSAEEEIFEDLFGTNSTAVQQALSEYQAIVNSAADEKSGLCLFASHKENLRRDFLNAHALQHFVAQNPRLHRVLLPHRVELYIRIKNSSQYLNTSRGLGAEGFPSAENQHIGTSVECPVQNLRDADALSPELRYQFLKFAEWFLDTNWYNDSDVSGFESVIDAVGKMQAVSGVEVTESPLEERMKDVLKLIEKCVEEGPRPRTRSTSDATTLCDNREENEVSPHSEEGHTGMGSSFTFAAASKDLHNAVLRKLNDIRNKKDESKSYYGVHSISHVA